MSKEYYPKKLLSFQEQISLLRERGVLIDNEELAFQFLQNVSYFRLQGFWWELQSDKTNHVFKKGITFQNIIDNYTFDRKLRILLFDAIERIEIALRTKMIYHISRELGQWWFEGNVNFFNSIFFERTLADIYKELKRSKEIFIKAHFHKYGEQQNPPAYKTLEVLSFGCLSKLYKNLHKSVPSKTIIAREFGLPNSFFLDSWLQCFNVIRNIIAHHSRIWNRNIASAPKQLRTSQYPFIKTPHNEHAMYHCISCILFVLNRVSPQNSIKVRLIQLINEEELNRAYEMGFPEDWRKQEIWK